MHDEGGEAGGSCGHSNHDDPSGADSQQNNDAHPLNQGINSHGIIYSFYSQFFGMPDLINDIVSDSKYHGFNSYSKIFIHKKIRADLTD